MAKAYRVEQYINHTSAYVADYNSATGAIDWSSAEEDAMLFADESEAEEVYAMAIASIDGRFTQTVSIEQVWRA